MRSILLLITILFLSVYSLKAQQPWDGSRSPLIQITHSQHQPLRTLTSDICGNGLDDDGNGLTDCEDYTCYFAAGNSGCNCVPIDVIWVCNEDAKLYWINHQTGVEHYVGQMPKVMTDITWAPNGKLYGVDFIENKIWEINPVTAQITFVTSISGYDASNAMTTDADGNFYLASRVTGSFTTWHVIKVNPVTSQVNIISDLTPSNSLSAGDLAYSNGKLYLACTLNRIATIDVGTGNVLTTPITGLFPGARIYGIVAKADGTLYLGDNSKLFRLDPVTMLASLYYSCRTAGMNIWGMSNFNDYCLAPGCAATVSIDVRSNLPFCNSGGVELQANGSGIMGTGTYRWTLPDGSTLTTRTITALQSGQYKVRYSTNPDTCGKEDSVVLQIQQSPQVHLPADTALCSGSQLTLLADQTPGLSHLWQDGSTAPWLLVSQEGWYWLETSNNCGSVRDSIYIMKATPPRVELGSSPAVCEFDTVQLRNFLDQPGYRYKWIDNSSQPVLVVNTPGTFWVDVTNSCGTVRDWVNVMNKVDGCECSLYMPTAFTPNNDGRNDLIKAGSNCGMNGELFIYNRNGEVVFHTKDLDKGWNGIYKGVQQGTDVYVFQVKYQYSPRPESFHKKGTFVLIR